jgi:hypothetical protein
MISMWAALGVIKWPLALSVVVVASLTLWSAVRLFGPAAAPDARTKAWLDAILFWGGFAFVTGALGTLWGVVLAAQSIERAGEVSAALVWGGIRVALLSATVGAVILAVSGLVWFVLQMRWRLLAAERVVSA